MPFISDADIAPATSVFLRQADLFLVPAEDVRPGSPGRLLLARPLTEGQRQSKQNRDMYTYVECDLIILDGPVTEKIETVPWVVDGFQFTGQQVTKALLNNLRKGKVLLGRMECHKPQGMGSFGWGFLAPTEEDIAFAQQYLAKERERARQAEAAALRGDAPESGGPSLSPDGPASATVTESTRPPWAGQR